MTGSHGMAALRPRKPWQFVHRSCYIPAPFPGPRNNQQGETSVRPIAFLPLVILTACAQAPTNQPASGAASDTAETHAAAPAAPAAPATASAQATPAADTVAAEGAAPQTEQRPSAPPVGYMVVIRNGQRFYCSDKPVLGSRLKSRQTCLTEEQYEMARQDAKDKMREKQGQENTWSQ
jgi:hypothetical protein